MPYLYSVCTTLMYFNIFVVCFFSFAICCCCCLIYTRVRLQQRYNQINQPVPAAETVINSLPTAEYKAGLMDPSDARCAICLCDYEEGEKIRYLPCHHHFHLECIDTWLTTNRNCPFCKHPVDTPLGESEMDSEFLSHNVIPSEVESGASNGDSSSDTQHEESPNEKDEVETDEKDEVM